MNTSDIQSLRGPILVLGAGGFVGSNLFLALSKERSDVYALVHHHTAWRLQGAQMDRIIQADLTSSSSVEHLIESVQPQTIFDCIAYGWIQ